MIDRLVDLLPDSPLVVPVVIIGSWLLMFAAAWWGGLIA